MGFCIGQHNSREIYLQGGGKGRIGQREKLTCHVVTWQELSNPVGRSGAGMALQRCPCFEGQS